MIDLKEVIKSCPGCLSNRSTFKSVLMDTYPLEKRMANILTNIVECGVADKIKSQSSISTVEMQRFIVQLENDYGIAPKYSQEAILIWARAYDVAVEKIKIVPEPSPAMEAPTPESIAYVSGDISDYEIERRPDGYYITKFNGFEEEKMTIPSMLDGKHIKGIAHEVFRGCLSIKSIQLSDGIEVIEDAAFADCKSLQVINLPKSLKKIGGTKTYDKHHGGVFESTNLSSVIIPQGVEYIGDSSFMRCGNLKRVDIPQSVKYIGEFAFSNCWSLQAIKLPDCVSEISSHAFEHCVNLANVNLPVNLKVIGEGAFDCCYTLREIHIPTGTHTIRANAFSNDKLTAVYIPPTVTTIGNNDWFDNYLFGKTSALTIYCSAGSAAMAFARKYGIKCAKALH